MPLVTPKEAAERLAAFEVVALPTETVYGLAGLVSSEQSLKKIFTTKGRPFFDPLIVHVRGIDQGMHYAQWDELSLSLAKEFWPGPLTLVLQKRQVVSDLITSGGPTVALRSPRHPMFQEVLEKLPAPLAAPSANRFGKTSPTTAQHVFEEFPDLSVVDGGPCLTGIESTVVEVKPSEKILKILRPGLIGKQKLQTFLNEIGFDYSVAYAEQNNAPGFLKNHYQPETRLTLAFPEGESSLEGLITLLKIKLGRAPVILPLPDDPSLAARELYGKLRYHSQRNEPMVVVVGPHWQSQEAWVPLLDRLKKAAHDWVIPQQGHWQINPKA